MANSKESENKRNLPTKLIASIVLLNICISVITSSIVAKTIIPTELPPALVPTNLQNSKIETNLISNGGFEQGLSGWVYSNQQEIGPVPGPKTGLTVFETQGVHGKAYCSRRYLLGSQTELLDKEWIGFVQDVSYDPLHSYLFSARLKLLQAVDVYLYARFYYYSEEVYGMFLNNAQEEMQGTSDDWLYVQSNIANLVPGRSTANRVVIGFLHAPIEKDTLTVESKVDSTFCIDDVVLEKIVK